MRPACVCLSFTGICLSILSYSVFGIVCFHCNTDLLVTTLLSAPVCFIFCAKTTCCGKRPCAVLSNYYFWQTVTVCRRTGGGTGKHALTTGGLTVASVFSFNIASST